MEYRRLKNGVTMPMEGFGVFQVRDFETCKESVLNAIKAGYHLIDTAASYGNEDAVGAAVKEAVEEGICKREDLFITSKLWVQDYTYEKAGPAIDDALKRLDTDYLDLLLIHQPFGDICHPYSFVHGFAPLLRCGMRFPLLLKL